MRHANKQDKDAILNIWTQCFGADMRYQNILTANNYPLEDTFVLEVNDQVVSILTLLPIQWQGKGEVRKGRYVYGVATLPQYRGKGYSSKLMKEALSMLKEQGEDFAVLYPAEEGLQDFYAKQGFVPCGAQIESDVDEEEQEAWLDAVDDYTDAGWELEPIESGKEYEEIRHALLEKGCKEQGGDGYFTWTAEHYAYNHNEAGYYGGGLCKICIDCEAVAIAGCWPSGGNSPWEQGNMILKEFLCDEEHRAGALSVLAEFAGSKSMVLCAPAWENKDSENKVAFGMIHWLKECAKVDMGDSYLALVVD